MTLIGAMGLKELTACRGYSVSLLQHQSYRCYIQLWARAIAPYHVDVFTQTNLHFYTYNYKVPALLQTQGFGLVSPDPLPLWVESGHKNSMYWHKTTMN